MTPGRNPVELSPITGLIQLKTATRKERDERLTGLCKTATQHGDYVDPPAARRLIRIMERERKTGKTADTLASPLRFLKCKTQEVSRLLGLYTSTLLTHAPTTFTVVPRTWEVAAADLHSLNITKLLAKLRTDLYDQGAREAGGWLYAFVHGEYDPIAKVFRIHVHGLCSRSMVLVLAKLRELPRYETRKREADGTRSAIYRPVRIRHKPLYDLPAPISYIVKGFWPSRPVIFTPEGKRIRVRDIQRIPEPYHSMVLLWLDRWSMNDLRLMIGLREGKNGLVVTKRGHRSS